MGNFLKYFIIALFVFAAFLPQAIFASTTNGTISGYAWSSQIGWINFGTTNGNAAITDSAVTGYAWNENTGRINLNPTNSGVVNNSEGTLSGKAWNEGTGWINFSGVTVSSAGVFSGTASGDNSVSINFDCTNCNVTTDWRPASSRSSGGGGGGSVGGSVSGGGGSVSGVFNGPFTIAINLGAQYTNKANVALSLSGGPEASSMVISNFSDFQSAASQSFSATKSWNLLEGDGSKTVYIKFYNAQGTASPVVSANVTLDTLAPSLQITSIKNSYGAAENVAVAGTTEPNAIISVFSDNNYGQLQANQFGNWTLNLGILPSGTHQLELLATDAAGNISPPAKASFSVAQAAPALPQVTLPPPFVLAPPLAPILRELAEGISFLLPKIFQPIAKTQPPPLVMVPKETPPAFKNAFHYIATESLAKLVLRPLPADVKLLAQKFPQVEKTFNEVGVKKITDLDKLSNANLTLPNLTETVTPKPALAVGKFAVPKGIPIEKLSAVAKQSIPSDIVFAKAAGGLVDLNVALSINNQGRPVQTIKTLSGKDVQLVIKPEKPVKKVTGYVVFKSKKTKPPGPQSSLNKMSASLLFANPTVAQLAGPSIQIPIEGVGGETKQPDDAPPDIETRLVVSRFEYQDSGNGVYTATVPMPVVDGEYEIITVIDYEGEVGQSKEIKLVTVIDPEGYIYEKNGSKETRVAGAVISIYWLNPESKQYELWPAKDFQQENPQTTDVRGTYSFLVPDGYYYLKVDAPGYLSYDGKPFEVKEGSGIHINIEMKTKYWFLNVVDWKTLLLIAVVLLLLYNFYKDKVRERKLA